MTPSQYRKERTQRGLSGGLDACGITAEERAKGVDIAALVAS